MKKKGFTLVELLVVISIIALLLAILMPSLQKAREQAKLVVCGSNLHQWGVVCFNFAADHDGYMPLAYRHFDGSAMPIMINDVTSKKTMGFADDSRDGEWRDL